MRPRPWHLFLSAIAISAACHGPGADRAAGTVQRPVQGRQASAPLRASQLGVGHDRTCVLTERRTVVCWGNGDSSTYFEDSRDVVSIAAGDHHWCVVRARGIASCWGGNELGQLGDGSPPDEANERLDPVRAGRLEHVRAIAAGSQHTCALLDGGAIECWGRNDAGQLGDGTLHLRSTPEPVRDIAGARYVAAGDHTSCAVLTGGTAWCWGLSLSQVATDYRWHPTAIPEPVPGLTRVASIAVGASHACALSDAGEVRCWGWNGYGQIGDGTRGDTRASPVRVGGLPPIAQLDAAEVATCGVSRVGQVLCWGRAWDAPGHYDDDTAMGMPVSLVPARVDSLAGAVEVGVGWEHSCARLIDGSVWCWGASTFGQAGAAAGTGSARPVRVRLESP